MMCLWVMWSTAMMKQKTTECQGIRVKDYFTQPVRSRHMLLTQYHFQLWGHLPDLGWCPQTQCKNMQPWHYHWTTNRHTGPTAYMWYKLICCRVIGHSFLVVPTVISDILSDILEIWMLPQTQDNNIVFHLAATPLNYAGSLWMIKWAFSRTAGWKTFLPFSLGFTSVEFYYWIYMKQIVHMIKTYYLDHLQQRIIDTSVPSDVLTWLWQEFKYWLDVCRAINSICIVLHYLCR